MNRKKVILVLFIFAASYIFLCTNNTFRGWVRTIKYDLKSKVDAYHPGEPLYMFFVNRRWNSIIERGPWVEGDLWTFYANGKFEYSFITDYFYGFEGDWKFVQLDDNRGYIYLDYPAQKREAGQVADIRIKRLIIVEAQNKRLYLDHQPFWGADIIATDNISAAVVTNSDFVQKNFPEYSLLLEEKWVKGNHINNDFIPHELTFFSDGTFFANFVRENPCSFKGDWSLSVLESNQVEIKLFVPDANCDLRGSKGINWWLAFKLTNTNLVDESFDYWNYHTE